MTDSAREYLERTPMRALLGIPNEYLDRAMGVAYQLYCGGRYADAEIMCRGLLAADHRYWWAYSLHAAALVKVGRSAEALAQVERGLRYEPAQPKLLAMRDELRAAQEGA
jgi:tetratricopeptide (TPR) repeat protein